MAGDYLGGPRADAPYKKFALTIIYATAVQLWRVTYGAYDLP